MKRIGGIVILTATEWTGRQQDASQRLLEVRMTEQAIQNVQEKVYEEQLRRARKASFQAGKFHAAGGYAKALKDARARVKHLEYTIDRWRPFVQALETIPGQITDDSDTSDPQAVLDFAAVRAEVREEREP